MSDQQTSIHASAEAIKRLKRRKGKETRFRLLGIAAIIAAVSMLIWLLISIVGTGYTAFYQHYLTVDVNLEESVLDPEGIRDPDALRKAPYRRILQNAMYEHFPDITERKARNDLFQIASASGATNQVRQMVYQNPSLVGQRLTLSVPTSDDVDQLLKGYIDRDVDEGVRRLSNQQISWIDEMVEQGKIESKFNWRFFTGTDSSDPELAGIASAFVGSLMALSLIHI